MIYAFTCECGSTREIEQSIHTEIISACLYRLPQFYVQSVVLSRYHL
jgi:hypothetical protein